MATSSEASAFPQLDADSYALIVSMLATSEVVTCAQVCVKLRWLCEEALRANTIVEHSTSITGVGLTWLARCKLGGSCVTMDVSGCKELTKAQICAAVGHCPALTELTDDTVPLALNDDTKARFDQLLTDVNRRAVYEAQQRVLGDWVTTTLNAASATTAAN